MKHNHRPALTDALQCCFACKHRQFIAVDNCVHLKCEHQHPIFGPHNICDKYKGCTTRTFAIEIVEGHKYILSSSLITTLIVDDGITLKHSQINVTEVTNDQEVIRD